MTVENLGSEIRSDEQYKYLIQTLGSKVQTVYVGDLAKYNYHRDNLTVSDGGLILYKGSRFLVPQVLRVGLLKALHMGHPRVQSMVLRAKETFWWPGLKEDIIQVRAICQMCHQNAPSQQKEPSMGVPISRYAFESISVDHFFLKGNEFLALVDRHSGMMSCHSTNYRGAREFLKILRLHSQPSECGQQRTLNIVHA